MERTSRFDTTDLNIVFFSVLVFLALTILSAFTFSVGIVGTESQQISATQMQRTTFLQEPFFGAQVEIKQETIEISEQVPTTMSSGNYSIQKIDTEAGTAVTQTILDPRPMTLGEALSLDLPAEDFLARFINPGIIPAVLIGFIGCNIAFLLCISVVRRKEEIEK